MNGYWISMHYATFGIFERDGVIVDAPPIARWTVGRSSAEVLSYYTGKGAVIKALL